MEQSLLSHWEQIRDLLTVGGVVLGALIGTLIWFVNRLISDNDEQHREFRQDIAQIRSQILELSRGLGIQDLSGGVNLHGDLARRMIDLQQNIATLSGLDNERHELRQVVRRIGETLSEQKHELEKMREEFGRVIWKKDG